MSSEVERKLVEYQFYTQLLEEYTNQLNTLNTLLLETNLTISSIERLKETAMPVEALTPLGSGAYVKTRIEGFERILINVGANVYIEKEVDSAIEILSRRRDTLRRNIEELQKVINEVYARAKALEEELQRAARETGGVRRAKKGV